MLNSAPSATTTNSWWRPRSNAEATVAPTSSSVDESPRVSMKPGAIHPQITARFHQRGRRGNRDSALSPWESVRFPSADRSPVTAIVARALESVRDVIGLQIVRSGSDNRREPRPYTRAIDEQHREVSSDASPPKRIKECHREAGIGPVWPCDTDAVVPMSARSGVPQRSRWDRARPLG